MPIYEHVVVAEDNSFPGKGGTALTTRVNTLTANKLEALAVGTVTTGAEGSNASVSITGTAPTQTVSFTIPRGPQGIQGIQGIKGDQGIPGIEGPPAATTIAFKPGTDLPSTYPTGISIMEVGADATGWPTNFAVVETVRFGVNRSFQTIVNRTTAKSWRRTPDANDAAWLSWVEWGAQGIQGNPGTAGTNATITSASASALAAGATPTVTLGGTDTARTFAFGIPAGAKGDTGNAGPANVLSIGTVTTGAAGSSASVSVSGASPTQSLSFTIPQGAKGDSGTAGTTPTVGVGTVTTGAAGSTAAVTEGGTATARTFNFTIPRGDQGVAGVTPTVGVGTVTTGAAGSTVQVSNGGTATARTFNFTIPRGDTGAPGTTPTVGVGTVTTGAEGSAVSVTEGGTATARTFNFTIPRGATGLQGNPGTPGTAGRGITSIADTDGDGTATVTYTDASTSNLTLPGAGPEGNPVIKYFLDAVRNRATTPVKIVLEGSSTANGGVVTRPAQKLVDRLSNLTTKNAVRTDLTNASATDIQWYETATGGTQADTYITSGEVTQLGTVQPTLIIHMIGSNDYGVQKDPAVFLSQLRTVINNIKAVTPNTRHLFMTHHAKNDMTPSTYPFHLYVNQMYTLASENPGLVSVVDLSKRFQRIGVPGPDIWGLVRTDNVHLDAWGSKILAYMMAEELGIPLPPDNMEIIEGAGYVGAGTKSTSFIHHTVTIEPKPYPREGMYFGTIYMYHSAAMTTDEANFSEYITYRSGTLSTPTTGAQSTVKTVRVRIPKTTVRQNVTSITTVYVAPHEKVVLEGYISIPGASGSPSVTPSIYVTGGPPYSLGSVQLSPI